MRERAFYYRGNRRLDPSRLDPAGTLGPRLEDSRKEILMQRIRNSPLNLLDGIKIDYATMIDRVLVVRSCKGKRLLTCRNNFVSFINSTTMIKFGWYKTSVINTKRTKLN